MLMTTKDEQKAARKAARQALETALPDDIDQTPQEIDPRTLLNAFKADKKLQSFIVEKFDEISQLKLERKEINDKITAIKAEIVTRGIPNEAVKMAHKMYELSDGEMADLIIGIVMCCTATGKGAQLDLLSDTTLH